MCTYIRTYIGSHYEVYDACKKKCFYFRINNKCITNYVTYANG